MSGAGDRASGVGSGAPTVPAHTGRGLFAIIGSLMLAVLLAALDQTIVGTALPVIVSDLGGLDHLSWVITAYLLAVTVGSPLWGKLGDQYGRKGIFLAAIGIFLLGSALCGLADSMLQLILFRGVQGIGGGGLIVLAMASVGDVVPPRQIGKYQGLFGVVFGGASVIGPLVGGFFTDGPGWPWIFYINLPLGAVALLVLAFTLPSRGVRHRHTIDYAGTGLLGAAAGAVVLATSWGGTSYAWNSPVIIGLFVLAVLLLVCWIPVERRADEPVLPLKLFGNSVFSVTSVLGFIVGVGMFGCIAFLPLFLQVVHGISPTGSGLHLLPMTAGVLLTAVSSGQLVSRTGHYKVFPIAGTAVLAIALFLLSRMDAETSTWSMSWRFFLLGMGLGLIMQVLVIIMQNAVEYKDLGVATSSATFFRTIGGCFGTAVFGSIFANQLTSNMTEAFAGRRPPPWFDPSTLQEHRGQLDRLPPDLRRSIIDAYADSLSSVFAWAVPLALVGFVLAWFIRQLPLRETNTVPPSFGEGLPGEVTDDDPWRQLERRLVALLRRDEDARSRYAELARAAGFELDAGAIWALIVIARSGSVDRYQLAARAEVGSDEGHPHLAQLLDHRLVVRYGDRLAITAAGWNAAEEILRARRQALARHLEGWSPEAHPELTELLRRFAEESFGDRSRGGGARGDQSRGGGA